MKKIVSMFLAVVCAVFMLPICINTKDSTQSNTKIHSNLVNMGNDADENDSSSYGITALIKFEEESSVFQADSQFADNTFDDDIDLCLERHRKKVKDHYVSENQKNVEESGLGDFDYDISWYAPFVELTFDDIDEYKLYEYGLNEIVLSNSNIAEMAIDYVVYGDATINDTDGSPYPLETAFSDIGVNNATFTGEGIRVGTLEPGTPHIENNLKSDKYVAIGNNPIEHTTIVTSIIGGTSGIAENVNLFCAVLDEEAYNFTSRVNTLLGTYNVNIINMSAGSYPFGLYMNFSAYIDYIIATTGCTFVCASANTGELDALISTQSCGMNVITVGSIDSDKNVSVFSSWDTQESFLIKPDVVAPGGSLSNIPNISGKRGGTSFAAPMVTGTIALLMEEFPMLKLYPALLKSVLHAGCEQLPTQNKQFDEHAGFGLINYNNMRNCLNNTRYSNFNISSNADIEDVVCSLNVAVPANSEMDIIVNWIINSRNARANYLTCTPEYTHCELRLYDISKARYVQTNDTGSNVGFLHIVNFNNAAYNYRIDVVPSSDKIGDEIEVGCVAYHTYQHSHKYTEWAYKNSLKHVEKCPCGATGTKTAPHTVSSASTGRYKICLGCGYKLDTFNDPIIGIFSNQSLPTSSNGSYILPNGIIVLVDADIDAYYARTLKFSVGETA